MISEIIEHTRITKDNSSLFNFNQDFSFLHQLEYEKNIASRRSFRSFDSKLEVSVGKDEIQIVFELLTRLIETTFMVPQIVELCIVDNKGIIDGCDGQKIYVYKNEAFHEIETTYIVKRDNLFIQEEMHDSDGIIFFLWDFTELPKIYLNSGRFYREIIMMSGLLGQIVAEYAELVSWKGTMFAGVMEADWRAFAPTEYSSKKPIFAYSFQK